MAVTRPSHNVGKVRWGSRAFITRMKTLDIDIPTPLKTIRLMNRVKLLLPIATVKNQLMGTDASIASAPKLTVMSAASVVVGRSSFDPKRLLRMYSVGSVISQESPAAIGALNPFWSIAAPD